MDVNEIYFAQNKKHLSRNFLGSILPLLCKRSHMELEKLDPITLLLIYYSIRILAGFLSYG
jgi:hypothetical protein